MEKLKIYIGFLPKTDLHPPQKKSVRSYESYDFSTFHFFRNFEKIINRTSNIEFSMKHDPIRFNCQLSTILRRGVKSWKTEQISAFFKKKDLQLYDTIQYDRIRYDTIFVRTSTSLRSRLDLALTSPRPRFDLASTSPRPRLDLASTSPRPREHVFEVLLAVCMILANRFLKVF